MIRLHYPGKNISLSAAVEKANEILSADAFYERIAALPEYGALESFEIAESLKKVNRQITIVTYRNPFGSATKTINPSLFKVNVSKISTVLPFAVHALIHQAMLSISMLSHHNQLRKETVQNTDDSDSLPRRIGEIAEIISRKARRLQKI